MASHKPLHNRDLALPPSPCPRLWRPFHTGGLVGSSSPPLAGSGRRWGRGRGQTLRTLCIQEGSPQGYVPRPSRLPPPPSPPSLPVPVPLSPNHPMLMTMRPNPTTRTHCRWLLASSSPLQELSRGKSWTGRRLKQAGESPSAYRLDSKEAIRANREALAG